MRSDTVSQYWSARTLKSFNNLSSLLREICKNLTEEKKLVRAIAWSKIPTDRRGGLKVVRFLRLQNLRLQL